VQPEQSKKKKISSDGRTEEPKATNAREAKPKQEQSDYQTRSEGGGTALNKTTKTGRGTELVCTLCCSLLLNALL
jgi:hypothetical protein